MGLSPEQNKRKQELLDKFLNYDFLTYDEITELAYLLKNDNTIDRKILPLLLMGLKQIALYLGYSISKDDMSIFES